MARAGARGAGGRPAARAGGVDGLARAAAQCCDAGRRPGVSRHHGPVACRAGRAAAEAGEAGHEPGAAGVRARPAGRRRPRPGRGGGRRAGGDLEGPSPRTAAAPALGERVEPAAEISRRLRLDFPGDETMRIRHEAVYQSLYVQGRGALRRELTACLRTGRALRVPRARSRGRGKSHVAPEVMVSQRPAEADDRAVPGHWEGDLILGLRSSAIGTLVERATRVTMLLHLPRMLAGPRRGSPPSRADPTRSHQSRAHARRGCAA